MRCKRAKTSPAKQKARRRPRAKRIPSAGGRFGWSDELWALIAPLLPAHQNTQPLGGGRPRAPDRVSAEAILFVLRTGCQWNALSATGLGASSTAHERCQAWREDGRFFALLARRGWPLARRSEASTGGGSVDWRWLSMDGAMTKAPLAGEKTGPSPVDRSKTGTKRSLLVEAGGGLRAYPNNPAAR